MKVIIFGCQQIAVDFINYLVTLPEIELPLVVTYELPMDQTYGYESVIREAGILGLTVRHPKRVTEELVQEIESIAPDIIFSIYYRKIFPQTLLDIPPLGCINVHPSILPDYRGPVPTAWAIENGETRTGVTIHYMDKGIDTGDILVQQEFPIGKQETGYELYTKAMEIGADMLKEHFWDLILGKIKSVKQTGIGSYFGKKNSKYKIDWQQRAEKINNNIRVHAKPYNTAESPILNHYVFINKAEIIKDGKYPPQGAGKIVDILEGEKLIVSCADGCLLLQDYDIFPELSEKEKIIYLRIGNKLE